MLWVLMIHNWKSSIAWSNDDFDDRDGGHIPFNKYVLSTYYVPSLT